MNERDDHDETVEEKKRRKKKKKGQSSCSPFLSHFFLLRAFFLSRSLFSSRRGARKNLFPFLSYEMSLINSSILSEAAK